jgi:hypothetical protein
MSFPYDGNNDTDNLWIDSAKRLLSVSLDLLLAAAESEPNAPVTCADVTLDTPSHTPREGFHLEE